MKIATTGEPRFRTRALAFFPMLVAVVLLAGCAGVASAPVASTPSAVAPQESPAPPPEAAPAPAPPSAEPEAAAETEAAPDVDAPTDDDVEAAEEVEPSPLDELPETAPELSNSTLEKEQQLVAELAPTFDIPMEVNPRVLGYVEYFTTRHKELFSASLVRSGMYVEMFRTIFEQAGIPKDLVYMAHVESAFKTNAYSRAKAKGIYQFIAGTGRRYGLRIDTWVDERSDPEKSARAAAAYLKDLYGMFGDWYLALAAYNAGEGKVQRSLHRTKKEDFWSLASTKTLRAETRNYVPAILAATLIAKQPEKYGFDIELQAPVVSESVKIEGQTDLRVLARLANLDGDTLRKMNPHLRRGMTPPGGVTDVYVPTGLGDAIAAAYAALPTAERMILARHQVGKGESLAFIARHYGVTSSAISSANRLGKNAALKPGQELVIPAVAAPATEIDLSRGTAVAYRVRKGDTLSRIAGMYRTTPGKIASASGISIHTPLRIGQRLVIPARGQAARASSSAAPPKSAPAARPTVAANAATVVHTVRRGETLYRIADQYQVTVDQICALNSIHADGVIYPGLRLKIRAN